MASEPPSPYVNACASAATSVSATKNVRPYMACGTPMSRTRAARPANHCASSSGRPNSLTSSAPETLNRSVMVAFIDALSW